MKKSLILVCLLVLLSGFAAAQITNPQTTDVPLRAVLAEQFTVTFTPSNVNGITWPALNPGAVNTSADTLGITTSWLVSGARTRIDVLGYFDTTNALSSTVNAGYHIPTNEVFPVVGGIQRPAFTSTIDTIDNASLFYTYPIDNTNRNNLAGDTKSVTLRLNLTGHAQLPPDIYDGVLHVHAELF